VWNTLLRHFLFRQVRWENVPITFFSLRSNLTAYPNMFASHFVADSKYWQMKAKSVWFFNGQCSFYKPFKTSFSLLGPEDL